MKNLRLKGSATKISADMSKLQDEVFKLIKNDKIAVEKIVFNHPAKSFAITIPYEAPPKLC